MARVEDRRGSRARARLVRPLAVTVAVCLAVCLATGCFASRYTYVSSTSTQTFFKVPGSWTVFRQAEIRRQAAPTAQGNLPFLVYFDANPRATVDQVPDFAHSAYPVGVARVRELGVQEHDQYSLASLRNEIIQVDDALSSDPNAVQVLATPKLITHKGLRGTQLEYTVRPPGDLPFSVDQVGLVDSPTKKVWFLFVSCAADCYARNRAAIHRIVDSWTVQGK